MGVSLSDFLMAELKKIDPAAEYNGYLPKIRSSTGSTYFVKFGSSSEYEQYVGEARSLEAIETAAPGLVPKLFSYGQEEGGRPYFISEYKNIGGLAGNATNMLAKRLAQELHQYQNREGFGFGVPTFCGATKQKNGWYKTWEHCYDDLIGNLLEGLAEHDYDDIVKIGKEVRGQYVEFLPGEW